MGDITCRSTWNDFTSNLGEFGEPGSELKKHKKDRDIQKMLKI